MNHAKLNYRYKTIQAPRQNANPANGRATKTGSTARSWRVVASFAGASRHRQAWLTPGNTFPSLCEESPGTPYSVRLPAKSITSSRLKVDLGSEAQDRVFTEPGINHIAHVLMSTDRPCNSGALSPRERYVDTKRRMSKQFFLPCGGRLERKIDAKSKWHRLAPELLELKQNFHSPDAFNLDGIRLTLCGRECMDVCMNVFYCMYVTAVYHLSGPYGGLRVMAKQRDRKRTCPPGFL
ncbi:uncharacterized protein CIMG_13690 [Coccidioides immitis RS]|uniref:Uncharacterized protein n=1 Tax=Coccidioides immitis (strain RS) TaxID=246410 RepID=A0A0D8JVW8_COCIM|nr:uncharacterized protein CIMG_13690 [Coccidioides immitis RS]KJF61470.1 hypothetical protein CIMG_13690 [Coccidioides immitis RS]